MLSGDPDRQVPILSYGFRPFFLLAGAYSVIAMTAWIVWLAIHTAGATVVAPTIAVAPHLWHGHEMIFGYATAVIAGFMLTAIPGWTGARRVAGAPLVVLAGLWLAGRIAVWFSATLDPLLVAALDLVFLVALTWTVANSLFKRATGRNLIFLGLLAMLFLANCMVHAQWLGWTDDTASRGLATGLTTLSLLIVVIGGRVVPAFTRNELMRQESDPALPRSFAGLDRASIVCAALVPLCLAFQAPDAIIGVVALAAAAASAARLCFWRGAATLKMPILWSLHLGYGWLVIGYAAIAAAHLTGQIGETTAFHVLAIGAVGSMTMAVMTRAALGHTNRPLAVHKAIALAYLMIAAAAIMRVAGATVLTSAYLPVMLISGTLWISGFGLFIAVYLPILTGPAANKPAGS